MCPNKQLADMLADLVALDGVGLSDWEIGFLDSLRNWEGDFSPKQVKSLKKMWFSRMTDDKIAERIDQWSDTEKAKAAEQPQAAAPMYPAGWEGRKF